MTPLIERPQLKQHDSGRFYIHYSIAGRSKRKSTKTDDPDKARRRFAQWLQAGGPVADNGSGYLLRDCLRRYWSTHAEQHTQDPRRIEIILRWLDDALGSYLLSSINPELINQYISDRQAGNVGHRKAQLSTIRRELSCLRSALQHCVTIRMVKAEDLPYIPLPKVPEKEYFWLTQEQVNQMLDYAKQNMDVSYRLWLFLCIGLATGARKSAIENLMWYQVDFEKGLVRFDMQVKVKTRKRKVAVPMSDWLRNILTAARMSRPSDGHVLGTGDDIRHEFDRFKKDLAQATGDKSFNRLTRHCLRHTAATQLLRNGASLWQVAGVLGDTVETVANIYGHHVSDHIKEATEMWRISE